ncbi:hypothetical protein BREVNS_1729 [Brevinematales bacterium NS]|nr:hypothetical protein BREVNS_1729 [Brevinematales bacterium NS]
MRPLPIRANVSEGECLSWEKYLSSRGRDVFSLFGETLFYDSPEYHRE